MLEASFAGAFAGGVLALLAPCGALLLPAFFAYAFTSPGALLRHTVLFYAGLCALLVPLGAGAGLAASLVIEHRDTTVFVAGALMIAFGVAQVMGRGFSLVPALGNRFRPGSSAVASVGAGLVYGLAGFCAGPLLGATLAVAATSASPGVGALLLATYALGTAAPLFVVAWLWERKGLGRRGWLRGGVLRLGPLAVHSTSLVSGVLFIFLGVTFILFQGGAALSGLYADLGFDNLGFAIQDRVVGMLELAPWWAGPAAGVSLAAGLLTLRFRQGWAPQRTGGDTAESVTGQPAR